MLVCALRGENVLIFHRHGDENEATLLGELVVDTSQPVSLLSTGRSSLSGSTYTARSKVNLQYVCFIWFIFISDSYIFCVISWVRFVEFTVYLWGLRGAF